MLRKFFLLLNRDMLEADHTTQTGLSKLKEKK